jgi:hypothetical protein
MTNFKPTPEQQRIIDEGEKWFAESRKTGVPISAHFVEKCTDQMGIAFKPSPRKSIISAVLSRLFEKN